MTCARVVAALAALANLVLPQSCAGCAAPGLLGRVPLCGDCAAALDGRARRTRPTPEPPGLPPVFATATYDGVVREAIGALKERGRLGLSPLLGAALARSARAAAGHAAALTLVPVPSAPGNRRRRGHDPVRDAGVVAARVLRRNGLDVRCLPLLRLQRRVADQAGLDASARAANLAGAMAVPARHRPLAVARPVVLLDDVVTTGATLVEAARALRQVGAPVVGAAVVAATQRWGPRLHVGGQED